MVIPALQCNQKAMQKLRPYYTDMHLCSATSKDRAFKKQVLSQHWYHVKRLRVSETETHWERHTENNSYGHRRAPWKVWFIKSSRWPCEEGTVKVRRCAPEPWWQDRHSFFPELFRLGEAKAGGFRLVSFGFLARILVSWAQIENALVSQNTFFKPAPDLFLTRCEPRQPLFTLAGIPRHKMRFIIIYEAGRKIAETNCSWHKFFELLFVGFFWYSFFFSSIYFTIELQLTTNILLKRTISQPLLFGFVDSQKRTVTSICRVQ